MVTAMLYMHDLEYDTWSHALGGELGFRTQDSEV
jgi:hypothetical protein